MALEKTTISLNLGQTLDQKDNDKVGEAGTFNDLKDWCWNKIKRLDKRPGTRKLPTTVQTSFLNPLTIGPSPIPSAVASHKDQLLLQNKGALYSYLQNEDVWKWVGHQAPIEVSTKNVAARPNSCFTPNMGRIGNTSVYAYIERSSLFPVQNGGVNAFQTNSTLRASVFDESAQAFISSNQIVDQNTKFSTVITPPMVVTFASACYLVWRAPNAANTADEIRIASVNLTTGVVGSVQTLVAALPQTFENPLASPNSQSPGMDWCYTNKTGVGERAFLSYYSAIGTVSVLAIKSDGTIDSAIGAFSINSVAKGTALYFHQASGSVVLGYQSGAQYRTYANILSFTASSITSANIIQLAVNSGFIHAISFCDDPTNAGQFYAVWDVYQSSSFGSDPFAPIITYPCLISYAICSPTAVISSLNPYSRGLSLSAKPIADVNRSTVYVPASHKSDLQDSLFLLDLKKGKTEAAAFSQARWSYGENATTYQAYLPQTIVTNNVVSFCSMRKERIVSSNLTFSKKTNSQYLTDIQRNDLNVTPATSSSHVFANNATLFSGGFIGSYDGVRLAEHGFFIDCETIEVLASATNDRITATTIQAGSTTQNSIYKIAFYGGSAMLAGPTNYWVFNTTSNLYAVWYKINGIGSPPTASLPGRILIEVDITGQETASELGVLTAAAINSAAPDVSAVPAQASLILTVIGTGGTVAPSTANYQAAPPSTSPTAGTYGYTAMWSWLDHNGQLVRGAPAAPVTITTTSTQPIAVNIYVPPITNRQVSDCKIEIYRSTGASSQSFTRIMSLDATPAWRANGTAISYLDQLTDDLIAANEFIYTTGGVLPNFQPGACKALSIFKERVMVSGFPGVSVNTIGYSKSGLPGEAIEFSEVLTLTTGEDGLPITAHHQLDDKLIVFKDKRIIAYAGDGANDLGTNATFSQPQTIASDVGCIGQNTVELVPDGLFFRSKMGIQKLDRSLLVTYPGVAVKDYNSSVLSKAQILRDDNSVREIRFCLSDQPFTIVYDYLLAKWTVFSNYGAQDACLWKGAFTRVDGLGLVSVEDKSLFVDQGSVSPSYAPLLETQWLKIKSVQDFQRISRMMILGDLKSPHVLNFQVYYDYDESNYDSYTFASSKIAGTAPGDSVYQPEIHLKRQKCQAIKIVVTVTPLGGSEESLNLTDMAFEVGVKRGLGKVKAGKKL